MGWYLEAARRLAVVARRKERSSNSLPSTEEVIGQLRADAFAFPGSLLGLQSVTVFRWRMNNEGYYDARLIGRAMNAWSRAGSALRPEARTRRTSDTSCDRDLVWL